jgi:bacillithiol biosynthesis cysteine-adding enzyme BshC
LAAHGYHVQVTPTADAVALFDLDGTRRTIRLQDDGFAVGERRYGHDELLGKVRDHPETFSPNVLLRPIVQDTLFPTIAYVSGPNELAYLGQLRQAYERFGVPMPLIYPRLSATLLDRASTKFLARHSLDFETLQAQDDSVLNRLISAQLPPEIETALSLAEQQVAETLDAIADTVPAVDPTLSGATRTTRERMERDLRTLRGKIVQAAKRRDETLRRQFSRARGQAFPEGHPQERAVASVYFFNKYGPNLVDQLLDSLPLDVGQHWLVTV